MFTRFLVVLLGQRTAPAVCALTSALVHTACVEDTGGTTTPEQNETVDPDVLSFERTRSAPVAGSPHERPQLGGLSSFVGGQASADLDRDGDQDVLIVTGDARGRLMLNQGEGKYTELPFLPELAVASAAPLFADINADLFPDLLIWDLSARSVRVLLNAEGEGFEDATQRSGLTSTFAPGSVLAAADVDADQDLDVLLGWWGSAWAAADGLTPQGVLWLNDGTGRFTDHSATLAQAVTDIDFLSAARFSDLDYDGRTDLVLAGEPVSQVLFNRTSKSGEPLFESLAEPSLPPSRNAHIADLDNNGELDVLFSRAAAAPHCEGQDAAVCQPAAPYEPPTAANTDAANTDAGSDQNDAAAPALEPADAGDAGTSLLLDAAPSAAPQTLADAAPYVLEGAANVLLSQTQPLEFELQDTQLASNAGMGVCIEDFNNDGWLDVLQADRPAPNRASLGLYLQIPSDPGTFIHTSEAAQLPEGVEFTLGTLCFDADGDGDLDILEQVRDEWGAFYRNTLNPSAGATHYLALDMRASAALPNVLGTRVTLSCNGRKQTREVQVRGTTLTQAPHVLHFGLGTCSEVEQVVIEWPDGALPSVLEQWPADQLLPITRR